MLPSVLHRPAAARIQPMRTVNRCCHDLQRTIPGCVSHKTCTCGKEWRFERGQETDLRGYTVQTRHLIEFPGTDHFYYCEGCGIEDAILEERVVAAFYATEEPPPLIVDPERLAA